MEGFAVEGRRPGATSLRRVPAGEAGYLRVLAAARRDGLDQIVVRAGGDRFVASGPGMALAGIAAGDRATWQGAFGYVENVLADATGETIQAAGVATVVAGVCLAAIGSVAAVPALGLAAAAAAAAGTLLIVGGDLFNRTAPGNPAAIIEVTEPLG
ncbi:MAG: hypothetical protein FJZ00_14940 [Candidatus Sericytochromatia bacterium]|uniref:Uncharacterized protein n=1 Tax=Candidatus Tanganyikabacteria bacterium TaxID=2961651 RepID=A0A937X977_9BACT|nr:hypothetical protein [Candidatus Tanganyikabacteria bacterium]